jgi:hypothetical protein
LGGQGPRGAINPQAARGAMRNHYFYMVVRIPGVPLIYRMARGPGASPIYTVAREPGVPPIHRVAGELGEPPIYRVAREPGKTPIYSTGWPGSHGYYQSTRCKGARIANKQ